MLRLLGCFFNSKTFHQHPLGAQHQQCDLTHETSLLWRLEDVFVSSLTTSHIFLGLPKKQSSVVVSLISGCIYQLGELSATLPRLILFHYCLRLHYFANSGKQLGEVMFFFFRIGKRIYFEIRHFSIRCEKTQPNLYTLTQNPEDEMSQWRKEKLMKRIMIETFGKYFEKRFQVGSGSNWTYGSQKPTDGFRVGTTFRYKLPTKKPQV